MTFMAGSGSGQYNGDSLFVSPDRLVLTHGVSGFRAGEARQQQCAATTATAYDGHATTHHQTVCTLASCS